MAFRTSGLSTNLSTPVPFLDAPPAEGVALALKEAFDAHCSAPGLSISAEKFAGYVNAKMCGSKIPRYQG